MSRRSDCNLQGGVVKIKSVKPKQSTTRLFCKLSNLLTESPPSDAMYFVYIDVCKMVKNCFKVSPQFCFSRVFEIKRYFRMVHLLKFVIDSNGPITAFCNSLPIAAVVRISFQALRYHSQRSSRSLQ